MRLWGSGSKFVPGSVATEGFPKLGGRPIVPEAAGRLHGEGAKYDFDHAGIVEGSLVAFGEEAQLAVMGFLMQDVRGAL